MFYFLKALTAVSAAALTSGLLMGASAGTAQTVAPAAASQVAAADVDSKVEIGNFYHRENGCHSSSQTARFTIQNADKLDRTRPGTIQGVTVEVYAANGGAITDAHFESPNVFVLIGTATGGGHWVSGPFGGGFCAGATGADIGAHVYGFFH